MYLQIGGGKLADKAAALRFLASTCDALVFAGSMAFQIMHAVGISVPMKLLEHGALKEAVSIVESAKSRNTPLILPKDIWCIKDLAPKEMEVFSVNSIPEGKSMNSSFNVYSILAQNRTPQVAWSYLF